MAKSKNDSTATRSNPVEVTAPNQAAALIAAWQGIHNFFGGRVESWEVVSPSEDMPEGGLIAHGFTVDGNYSPTQLLEDISVRDRRVPLFPAYSYLTDANATPPAFADAKEMTAWSVQFLRGSVEEGTARTPDYAKTAINAYKSNLGMATRRGRARKIFRLDEITELDEKAIRSIPKDQLAEFLAKANVVVNETPDNTGESTTAEVATA